MFWSSVFTLATLSLAGASPTPHVPNSQRFTKRQNSNPGVPGNSVQGWQTLPTVANATLHESFSVAGGVLPLFQSSNRTASNIKRAVIILPGKLRDCWYYFNTVNNGLIQAAEEYDDITQESISIMGPCFLTQEDLDAGAASQGQFLWGDTTWASGHYNEAPSKPSKVSSYDVMDGLVEHYMDQTMYPNLEAVVVGGHSLGAQMAQRYLGLRKTTVHDDRLQWWIANSGSFMWLVEDRPHPDGTCDGVDVFKYGLDGGFPGYALGDANDLGRDGLQARYRARVAHYAQGLDDDGNGDTRCQAMTQGSTHLERGQNFQDMLGNMTGGMPAATTFDYIEGVSHFNEGMVYSVEGKDKLFRFLPAQTAKDLVKNALPSSVTNLISKLF